VSIEDRVRDATRARTDLVRGTRPLDLPLELPARPSARANRDRGRRWLGWGAPVAAAAVIAVLAVTLVLVRQAGGPHSAPAAPAGRPSGAAVPVPRYYAALATYDSSRMKVVVGDDRTGRTLAVLNPPAGESFYGVTGAADDRTFVVTSAASGATSWYLLRLSPGAAQPAQLKKLPIKPINTQVTGLALSPDGRELAVMYEAGPGRAAPTYLTVYSLSSGAVLHRWGNRSANGALGTGANAEGLSWVDGDRSLDFRWGVVSPFSNPRQVRTIDLTAAGADLLGSSRVALTEPPGIAPADSGPADGTSSVPCLDSLAAPDGTIVCGSVSIGGSPSGDACRAVPPSFVSYSGTTGKRLRLLYQYRGHCLEGRSEPLWTDAGGRQVLALFMLQVNGEGASASNQFALISDGHFTPLPRLVVPTSAPQGGTSDPGGFAF
jgi:hypothetical protein